MCRWYRLEYVKRIVTIELNEKPDKSGEQKKRWNEVDGKKPIIHRRANEPRSTTWIKTK